MKTDWTVHHNLSQRALTVLDNSGLSTDKERTITEIQNSQILKYRNCGPLTMKEIAHALGVELNSTTNRRPANPPKRCPHCNEPLKVKMFCVVEAIKDETD